MLQKIDGSFVGFTFVESASENKAVNAFEALLSSHLYVRFVVVKSADKNDACSLSVA